MQKPLFRLASTLEAAKGKVGVEEGFCVGDADIVEPCDWFGKDCIRLIMVHYEKTNVAIDGHKRECSCQVGINNT